jgi:hypothetical protein
VSLLIELLSAVLPDVLMSGSERRRDRRLLAENRARCAIRAVRGRVLNIGTEWSAGICSISRRHLQFHPTIGIVGDRKIDVVSLALSEIDPDEVVYLGLGQTLTYLIRTEAGDLYWALPDRIAERAKALLLEEVG